MKEIFYPNSNGFWKNGFVDGSHALLIGHTHSPALGNTIYHNSFWDNYLPAFDSGTNAWHSGYPAGGNYWKYYDSGSEGCVDLYWGENQDQPGADGMCDAPYVGNGLVDNYPWTTWDGWDR